jgi:hypothetical protein
LQLYWASQSVVAADQRSIAAIRTLKVVEPSPFPRGQMRNDAEELFALAFWEMTIVVEVMLTTVVEVGMPAPSNTAFEALAEKAGERARDAGHGDPDSWFGSRSLRHDISS